MRVGKWRRDHDIAPGARPCRAPCRGQSRGMQNSQRVLLAKPRNGNGAHDAKPRTAVASRHGQWRGGAMGTSRPTAKPHEGFARQRGMRGAHGEGARCEAAHRGGEPPRAMARRREPGGWGAPTGGGGQASRPTAMPHGCAHRDGTRAVRAAMGVSPSARGEGKKRYSEKWSNPFLGRSFPPDSPLP